MRVAKAARGIAPLALLSDFLNGPPRRLRGCLQRGAQTIGIERAGQQVVDRDVLAYGFARNSGDEPGEAATGAIGQAENVDWRFYGARRDVDDPAEAALHHAIYCGFDQLDRCEHVGIDGLDPILASPIMKIAWRRATCVIDQDVRGRARLERCGPSL